jgi:hypothetical protein
MHQRHDAGRAAAQARAEWTALERMADEIERAALQGTPSPGRVCH